MFTNGIVLSIAVSNPALAGKLLSDAENAIASYDQPSAKFAALRNSSKPKVAAIQESKSFAVAACEPSAK